MVLPMLMHLILVYELPPAVLTFVLRFFLGPRSTAWVFFGVSALAALVLALTAPSGGSIGMFFGCWLIVIPGSGIGIIAAQRIEAVLRDRKEHQG
jgi:hypothetical protein